MTSNNEIPKAGLLLFEAKWFIDLGIGAEGGSVGDLGSLLKQEINKIEGSLSGKVNLVNPGIIFDIESARKAMELFRQEKVDLVIVVYLTWAEDLAWIEILKNIGDIPIFILGIYERFLYNRTIQRT